jgi:single-stranded DNA-specific DHH superfamily exonuclease
MGFIRGSEKDFIEFVSYIDDKDRVGLLTHNDIDGLVSVFFLEKLLGKADFIDFLSYKKNMLEDYPEILKKNKINKVVITDLCVESGKNFLEKINEFADVLVIDHHQWENPDMQGLILTSQESIPAFLCYKFSNNFHNVEDFDFLAAIALVSDYVFMYPEASEFIKKVEKKYSLKKNKDIFNSEIGTITEKINNSVVYFKEKDEGIRKIYDLIKKIKKISDVSEFERYSEKIERELERVEKDFLKNREVHDWGYVYFLKSSFRISSLFSTKIAKQEPDKIYIILKQSLSESVFIDVSARNQSRKYNCSEILKKSVSGLEKGNAGGHIPAAGGQILKKDLEKFREKLISVLKDY